SDLLDGVAVNSHSSTGPHQRWSTGTLYDTITTDNLIEARNRGNFGSGHGWAGAGMVFWNARAEQFIAQNPPTAQNWVIGSTGTLVNETRFGQQPPATVDAHGTPIDFGDPANPTSSLFVAQHNQRLSEANEKREYAIGDFDHGFYDGPATADAMAVDAGWLADVIALGSPLPIETSDQNTDGHLVPFSFQYQLDANEIVRSATISIGLRGTGGDTTDDDYIWLDDLGVSRSLSSLGLTDTLLVDETTVLTLELTGVDRALVQDGLLNVLVGGNVAVDWAVADLGVERLSEFDLGDAPAPYPTLLTDDGARHGAGGPRLGATATQESDANPTAMSDGDIDDGVMFGDITIGNPLAGVNIDLQNAAEAKVDAWIDFDGDGVWQADERILDGATVLEGLQTLNYSLPADASLGETFARVRVSSVGGLLATGLHFEGEVEDYLVTVGELVDVENVVINQGEQQRSSVSEVVVAFDSEIDVPPTAFSVVDRATMQSIGLDITTAIVDQKTVATLTFQAGDGVETRDNGLNSLVDGNYELRLDATQIVGANRLAESFVFGDQEADAFFRYFGDSDGDRDSDGQDYGRFGLAFLTSTGDPNYDSGLDFDGDGDIDGQDFGRFGSRFLGNLPFS
ncbi:MAG: GEVED domain-containing protein, partial [Planctomycetota bacterium]